MECNNEFQRMRDLINNVVEQYKAVFKECDIKQKWHSESIFRNAAPFLNGYFTLSIVGKMSSGKSTFINTLIGENILPTGHFQTTSAVTYIEHADRPKMIVSFCDGHKQTFEGSSIAESLKGLVSIDPEYSSLPVNKINELIAKGCTLEEVLEQKSEIEKEKDITSSEDLWIKYYESHPSSVLEEKVQIYYPLSSDFYGWRIIDTPGIGAIGGIDDITNRLFAKRDKNGNKIVDAIIFLQSGADNIESLDTSKFVKNTFSQLTDEAKKRVFFVLTHTTSEKFRLNRDRIVLKAEEIYTKPLSIPNERLILIDSLMARFHRDLLANNEDISSFDPSEDDLPLYSGWNSKEWEAMCELITPIKKELKRRGLARNNETIFNLMEEWGNFHTLIKSLNAFVKKEKEKVAKDILDLIEKDYSGILNNYRTDIETVEGGVKAIKDRRKDLDDKRSAYNDVVNNLRRVAKKEQLLERFSFVDERLNNLDEKKSKEEIRIEYQNIIDATHKAVKDYFDYLKRKFEAFCNEFDAKDPILDQIDFESLENQARAESTEKEDVYKEETYYTGWCCPERHTRKVKVGTKDRVNPVKEFETFKRFVRNESRKIKDSFFTQLIKHVKNLCDHVQKDIEIKMDELQNHLNELEMSLTEEDEVLDRLRRYESLISSILNPN